MRGFRSHIGWKTFGQSSIRAWAPLNVVVIQIAGGIRITWTNNPSATETEIWVSQDGAAYALVYTAGTGVATYDYTCDNGSTYNVELRSKIDSTVLNAPNTIATSSQVGGVQITWNDNNTSADHIEVWCNIAGAGYTLIATVLAGVQTYTHAATLGNDNIYKVRAKEGTLPVYSSYSTTSEIVYVISPIIATTTPSSITSTTASSGGNISNAGGHTITARGVCWKTSSGATPSDSHTSDGSGTGTFTSSVTGLSAVTLYYIRAYATTPEGTFYGDEQTFTSAANTSYANAGGTGDRHTLITVTGTVVWVVYGPAAPEHLVNGVTNTNDYDAFGSNPNITGIYIQFDFLAGNQKIINEAKWYQTSAVYSHGTWKWQGSNDGSSFTDIGTSFTLGGALVQTITNISGNSTAYRYYRLTGVSGATNANPYICEVEFKIA